MVTICQRPLNKSYGKALDLGLFIFTVIFVNLVPKSHWQECSWRCVGRNYLVDKEAQDDLFCVSRLYRRELFSSYLVLTVRGPSLSAGTLANRNKLPKMRHTIQFPTAWVCKSDKGTSLFISFLAFLVAGHQVSN